MAGSKRSAKGSFPNFCDNATHVLTAPGTVTESHPWVGMLGPLKRLGVHAAGDLPEPLIPVRSCPSQTMAKASLPTPFIVGSTTVRVIAVAIAASTALPPRRSMSMPAWVASGCDVATAFRANTGALLETYGKDQLNIV